MFLPDYKQIITNAGISSIPALNKFFEEEILYDWFDLYKRESLLSGEVTWQNFKGFTFGFGYAYNTEQAPASSLPDSRVVATFGVSTHLVRNTDRHIMRKYLWHLQKFLLTSAGITIGTFHSTLFRWSY